MWNNLGNFYLILVIHIVQVVQSVWVISVPQKNQQRFKCLRLLLDVIAYVHLRNGYCVGSRQIRYAMTSVRQFSSSQYMITFRAPGKIYASVVLHFTTFLQRFTECPTILLHFTHLQSYKMGKNVLQNPAISYNFIPEILQTP